MIRREHPLVSPSLGTQRTLVSLHFGAPDARPKVFIQASLHADELPGMLVAHHLRQALEIAETQGRLRGQVVLVPAANPVGLAQRVDHRAMGRFELNSGENFNRHYPDLALVIADRLRDHLDSDGQANVNRVRRALAHWLQHDWVPVTELDSLRHILLSLAFDADRVLDLHCDSEAVMHLYSEEACWPQLKPLAALLGCRAVLIARESGGGPFDERLSGLWWQLRDRLDLDPMRCPLPQACASTTVELRGEAQVEHGLARSDAQALLDYLVHEGVVIGDAIQPPALACEPTPLAGSQTLFSPTPGVLVFLAELGQSLAVGDAVAEVIDPTAPQARVHTVRSNVAGVFYARVRERYVTAGGEVGKVAGAVPFRQGPLLGA